MDDGTLSITAETGRLNDALLKLANVTGKKFGTVVLQNARLIAWNLAFQTRIARRFGMELAIKKAGEGEVMADVGRVFISSKAIYGKLKLQNAKLARSFAALIQQGNFSAASQLLQTSTLAEKNAAIGALNPRFHRDNRNEHGMIKLHTPLQIVPDAKSIKAYAKERAQLIGFAKAGWITAGDGLGKRVNKVPGWIRRHVGTAPGTGDDNTKGVDPHAVLSNHVRYIGSVITSSNIAYALAMQRSKMEDHIDFVLGAEAKAAGFHYTGPAGTNPAALAA